VLGCVDGGQACRFLCHGLGGRRLKRVLRGSPLGGLGVEEVLRRFGLLRN
jgi:hypothetical protein